MTFEQLRLAEPILRAVAAAGYTAPTPIQFKAIPEVLAGRDVLGCARTGTGKTGAFALPLLHRLSASRAARTNGAERRAGRPRALVLAPTRELATQIHESFTTYGAHLPLRHAVIFGGVSQSRQVRALKAGVDVLIATPGRLLDLMGQGFVDLGGVEALVLDEADRMLDMGFIRDIRKVVERMPVERQTLLFSATMPDEIRRLADSILREPVFVKADPVSSAAEAITQSVYLVTRKNKPMLLERLLRRDGMERTLVFTRTKHGADRVVKALRRSGLAAEAIHGNKNQNARTRALEGFKSGRTPVLVATDIASRGIDVDEITHVVNFDMPNVAETYVHRIGRTARAGASGEAVSFCDHEELGDLRSIERLVGRALTVRGDEADLIYTAPAEARQRDTRRAAPNGSTGTRRRRRSRSRTGGTSSSDASTADRSSRRGSAAASAAPQKNRTKRGGRSSGAKANSSALSRRAAAGRISRSRGG